jgi:hypothetical protein
MRIERMYVLEPDQRTVSNFANIIGELKERLHRWTRAGQYGFLFDNAEDTLSFSRFQTFNFAGWGDAPEVLEPLLFYVLHRASNEICRSEEDSPPSRCSCSMRHGSSSATRRSATTSSRPRRHGAKLNAAMILATQSLKELQESGMLQIVSESCPTKIFLANPEMDRDLYREAFHLNDTELELIAGLGAARPDAHSQSAVLEEGSSERRFRHALDGDQQRPRQPEEARVFRAFRHCRGLAPSCRTIPSGRARWPAPTPQP